MPIDAIELEVFRNLFHSIAEDMGTALRRSSFSPNIKERRDYSCAVFDRHGEVIAMGDHMPVHLGSMPMSVRAAIDAFSGSNALAPGDIAMLNDPFAGGTHLPDITLVAPVFIGQPTSARRSAIKKSLPKHTRRAPDFYVASRAHHADVGGMHPGSMGLCESIYQEGIRIPPVKLVTKGDMNTDILALLLANVRTPQERHGDLAAQIAACHSGAERLRDACARYGLPRVHAAAAALHHYAERMLRTVLAQVPPGEYQAEDALDDDGYSADPVPIRVKLTFHSRRKRNVGAPSKPSVGFGGKSEKLVTIDFTGSAPQVRGSINAVRAITYSACFFVFRCLLAEDVPASAGIMRPVQLITEPGTIVDSHPPAAVAGGNVECSQRIVDVLLRALAQALPERIPSASYGTMSNLTIGGFDDRDSDGNSHRKTAAPFTYYETIAGGMGARPTKDGVSGIHMHMTNSLNTPAEALEYAYPLRVTEYRLRSARSEHETASGGGGIYHGGDGIIRELELLSDAEVTLLADRHKTQPYGLNGGAPGLSASATVIDPSGDSHKIPSKGSRALQKGTRIRIETPGGGGWGKAK